MLLHGENTEEEKKNYITVAIAWTFAANYLSLYLED